MNTLLRAAVAVATVALVGAVPASAQGVPEGATQAMVDKGNEIYHKSGLCYACHGQDGKGLVGPNLTDDVWIHNKGTFPELVSQIAKGVTKEESKTGVPMPAKGGSSISDEEVKAVAAYVWSLSHK